MAGRVIKIKSVQLNHAVHEYYGIRDESVKSIPFWKRSLHKHDRPEFITDDRNKFTNNISFCMFFISLGNGYHEMPISMKLALIVSGGLYLIYQIIFTLLLAWPVLYVESFLGEYSLLTNSHMYRMVPIFFGACIIRCVQDVVFAAQRSISIAMALVATFEHLIYHESNCKQDVDNLCVDYFQPDYPLMSNCTMKYYMLDCGGESRMLVTPFLYWMNILKLGNFQANWIVVGTVLVTWLMIAIMSMFKMKVIELLLRITLIVSLIMHTVLFIMALAGDGATTAMKNIIDFQVTTIDLQSIILCAFFAPLRYHATVGGCYMNYWSNKTFKSKFGYNSNSLFLIMFNLLIHVYKLVIYHAVLGIVGYGSGVYYKHILNSFDAMYYATISEFFRIVRCPRPFIACYHFSTWLVECTKLTILITMHMNSMNYFFPRIVRFRLYTRLSWSFACIFVAMIFTFGIFLKYINNVLLLVNLYALQAFELIVWSVMIFYGYGLSRLNDDIHFITGKRPAKMWRIIWYIYPFLMIALMLALIMNQVYNDDSKIIFFNDFIYNKHLFDSFVYLCVSAVAGALISSFVMSFLYIVINIRASKKIRMTTPLFYWGPMDDDTRIARKEFTPRIAIRSQKPKEYRQRFRLWSVRQQHESDFANRVKNGRMFLDTTFFLNISNRRQEHDIHFRIRSKYSRYSEDLTGGINYNEVMEYDYEYETEPDEVETVEVENTVENVEDGDAEKSEDDDDPENEINDSFRDLHYINSDNEP